MTSLSRTSVISRHPTSKSMRSPMGVGYRSVLNTGGRVGGGDGLSIACSILSASADSGSLERCEYSDTSRKNVQ